MPAKPRISFGIIVLNGEPFTRYCIEQLYPFAHQIIVAEGACPAAASIAMPDGHSSDGTLDILRDLQANHDPENKITIVTAEDEGHPNGFWPGEKAEQSAAWAQRATGDYLWIVDIDEFYRAEDITALIDMLAIDSDIDCVMVKQIAFWGGFDYRMDGWYFRLGTRTMCHPQDQVYRIFRWGEGYQYTDHRPPTVTSPAGKITRSGKLVTSQDLAARGIFMYHYMSVFRHQIMDKLDYYHNASWKKSRVPSAEVYIEQVYSHIRKNPFKVHFIQEYPSWLTHFRQPHPEQIQALRRDIESGKIQMEMLPPEEVDDILSSPLYSLRRAYYKGKVCIYPFFSTWSRRYDYYLGEGLGKGLKRAMTKLGIKDSES